MSGAAPAGAAAAACGGGGPCGACKFLRRKCVSECVFAPYFDPEHGAAHFAAVHKIFGASNVSKLLHSIPASKRLDAVVTICYEAQARIRDPVYGCVAHIFALQQQVVNLQTELSCLQAHLAALEQVPPPAAPAFVVLPPPSSAGFTGDLAVLLDNYERTFGDDVDATFVHSRWQTGILVIKSWQQQLLRQLDFRHLVGSGGASTSSAATPADGSSGGDLEAVVTRELLNRRSHPMNPPIQPPPPLK